MKKNEDQDLQLDKRSLIKLYEENNEALYRYAYRYLSNQDLAEECVSEVFTRYLQVLQSGKSPNGHTKAYFYRIAHNWIIDYYRKRKPDENVGEDLIPDQKTNPELLFSNKQMHERLRKALLKLPEEQRMVIELRIMEEWSHEEVAEHLGKTVEASRAMQYRAVKQLRKTLDGIGKWKR
jgi:RNA polymerase sigma-70 factor (ECF subfamily)